MFSIFYEFVNYIFHFFISAKDQFLQSYIYGFCTIKALEMIGLVFGFIFIHLMIKENPYAWLIATFNCSLLIYILGSKGFIGQIFLYMVFWCNSLYAFFKWRKRDKNNKPVVKIKWLKPQVSFLLLICLVCLVYGIVHLIYFLKTIFPITSNSTYLDIFIVVFSLYALILQINKNVEGWFYFTVVDALTFVLYITSGLYVLSIVRGYITVISAYGFIRWIIKYSKEKRKQSLVVE